MIQRSPHAANAWCGWWMAGSSMVDAARAWLALRLPLTLRLAGRELRGGLRGFRLFLFCLALGAALIAGIGSLADSVREGINRDAKALLGGDVELRMLYRP